MHTLTALLLEDMRPALGVTEPGAIAFAVAKARTFTKGEIQEVCVVLNSGIYKNGFTCGIPYTNKVGNPFAAALGAIAGNADKGLEALADVTHTDTLLAQELVSQNKVHVELSDITPEIFIQATVITDSDECRVTILGSHTNICEIICNGEVVLQREAADTTGQHCQVERKLPIIHTYTLQEIYAFARTVPLDEIYFLKKAYTVNEELFLEGVHSPRTTFAKQLLQENGGEFYSSDEWKTAQLLCNTTIEARVIGLNKPAMSITGSGAHGIICTMPLFAVYKTRGLLEEQLLRATALSYLVTIFIKEYSGKLSAFCGCAVAAGTGMACGLVYLWGGSVMQIGNAINNMASSITGMICDGGNQGCTMKGIVAVDAAFRSAKLALNGVSVASVHGINGVTPEETMQQMGQIASPGMIATEEVILDILEQKLVRTE